MSSRHQVEHPTEGSRRELAIYTASEVAQHLSLPNGTVRYWALGRADARPLIEPPQLRSPLLLSFFNLVELYIISTVRRTHEVKMSRVRTALDRLRTMAQTGFERRHPWLQRTLLTDGGSLFVEVYGQLINLSQDGQAEMRQFIESALSRIEIDTAALPLRFFPHTRPTRDFGPRTILIDPRLSGGRPVLNGTGLATELIAERYALGESIDDLASDYDCGRARVEEAIRYELRAA